MQSKNGKNKVLKKITTDVKEEVVEKHECGICAIDLTSEYKMVKLTILTVFEE